MTTITDPIGIFDSGIGGISVLKECVKRLPNEHYIYYGDSAFAPYGTRPKQEVIDRCIYICDFFMKQNVKAIIIACNTATSVAIDILRDKYPVPIIGMEPALKVAANDSENQTIAVMATPLTLKEEKFNALMHQYDQKNTIIKMPCPEFVEIIEQDKPNRQELVNKQLNEFEHILKTNKIDSIVLGCTHFTFLKKEINTYFKNAIPLIDGNRGTVNHLSKLLNEKDLLNTNELQVELHNSNPEMIELSKKLLENTNC